MRLIDADDLIESMGLENAVKWGNKDGYQQAHSYSTMMLYEIKDSIDCQITVDAVPLDKLCEWLETNCILSCVGCDHLFGGQWCKQHPEDPYRCHRKEYWKNVLTKWMEEQHG